MSKPITAHTMTSAMQAVIWQPFIEGEGVAEAALLVQRDAA